MTTSIDNLLIEIHEESVNISDENYVSIAMDFSVPIETRMKSLYFFKTVEDISEFLKRLISIFSMSMSTVIQTYMYEIALKSHFPLVIRLELAKDISFTKDDDICFEALDILCPEMLDSEDISAIKKVEAIQALMRCKKYMNSSLLYFYHFIDNQKIDCEYRYKTIISLKTTYDMRKQWVGKEERDRLASDYEFFDKSSLTHFCLNDANAPSMRILAGQSFLVKYGIDSDIIKALLDIANNIEVEYNTRADSTDVVLRYGDDESKAIAKNIIINLGKVGHKGEVRTIYESAQNAHGESIEQSAILCFEKIAKFKLIKKNDTDDIDFDYVVDQLGKLGEDATITLNRINMDNALYTKFSCSLKTALVVMYSFIKSSVYYDTLKARLIEELSSSAGICSSGIFERLMNVPSGIIDDMSLTISFEEQIIANLTGRLNAKIRGIVALPCMHKRFCDCRSKICIFGIEKNRKTPVRRRNGVALHPCGVCVGCKGVECVHECSDNCNEELCDKILEEMVIPTKEHIKRKTFLLFFNTYISDIIEELRGEFKEYMDETTFELYMNRAIIQYIGGN